MPSCSVVATLLDSLQFTDSNRLGQNFAESIAFRKTFKHICNQSIKLLMTAPGIHLHSTFGAKTYCYAVAISLVTK